MERKRSLIILFFCLIFNSVFAQDKASIKYGDNPKAGNYAKINGLKIYHETYGEGKPLLLLHGNGGSIVGHSKRIEYFKNTYKVIAMDSRAH